MATSRQIPRNQTTEDDSQDDAAIITKTTIGTPSCGDILSTPPRINRVFGLVTPDSPSQRNSCQFGSISPPRTPTRSRGVPKDTKSPTFTGNPSERSSGPGLVTPDHTPPRDSKARPIPIRRREETKDKSELSRSLETTSTSVLEVLETFQHQAEDIPYTGKPGQLKTLCRGITKKTCAEPAKAPNHHEQDTSPPPSTSSVGVRGPQRRQSKDTAANPTTDVNSKLCGQLTRLGNPCKIRVKPPAQSCRHHWQSASHNTPASPTAPNTTPKPTTDVNLKLCGQLARLGNLRVEPPAQYYRHHWQSANHDTPTSPTTPNTTAKPTTDVNSKLCGQSTRLGNPCKIRVKPPAQYCRHHWQPASHNTPTSPTTPNATAKPTTDVNSKLCGQLTRLGNLCKVRVKPPAQYCRHHWQSASHNTPTSPTTPNTTAKLTTDVKSKLCGQLTQLGNPCKVRVKPPAQYCHHHQSASDGTVREIVRCVTFDDEGFKVRQPGQEEVSVRFCDYIPGYLQPDTQKKLRNTIKKDLGERDRKSGYVYALNVLDPENEGKLSLKIGYTVRAVKKRHANWKAQCRSYMKGVRGWWPETIRERKDDDEVSIQKLLENNMEGVVGPMVVQLERLVHIELRDLATHAPYLRPDFPDVRLSDVQRLSEAPPIKVCGDCKKNTRKYSHSGEPRKVNSLGENGKVSSNL